ncbi:MAG: helix-turn-helix domain-containing protein [Deltaproteobacteria bacterium]|nr:helix-turn-helix domain-containing protein [Deltaproteobacteria bacterium]
MDIITTRQVADLLAVSEATVKRWADSGTIRCFRTPGGHRKFRMADIAEFLKAYSYESTGPTHTETPAPASGPRMSDGAPASRAEPSFVSTGLSEASLRFRNLALQGDAEGLISLIAQQRLRGFALPSIFDDIAAPALEDIGRMWTSAAISVAQEHLASQTVIEALARIKPLIERPAANRGSALLAAPGLEQHDIALRMATLVLCGMGFQPIMLGPTSPVQDLITMIASSNPSVTILSFAASHDRKHIATTLAEIEKSPRVGRLIVGGEGLTGVELPARCERVMSLSDLAYRLKTDAQVH